MAGFWLQQHIPFDPFGLLSDLSQLWLMPLFLLTVVVPFFFAGLALGLLFTRGSARVNRLYAFDLLGAGLGCGAVALILPVFGGAGAVVVAAVVGLVGQLGFRLEGSAARSARRGCTCRRLPDAGIGRRDGIAAHDHGQQAQHRIEADLFGMEHVLPD